MPYDTQKLCGIKLRATNQGFREAQKNRTWEPDTK